MTKKLYASIEQWVQAEANGSRAEGLTERPPLDPAVIPNYMGINLVSVGGISWDRLDDGQLLRMTVFFLPRFEPNRPRVEYDPQVYLPGLTEHLRALNAKELVARPSDYLREIIDQIAAGYHELEGTDGPDAYSDREVSPAEQAARVARTRLNELALLLDANVDQLWPGPLGAVFAAIAQARQDEAGLAAWALAVGV